RAVDAGEAAPLVTGPARRPVVAVGADPVHVLIAGVEGRGRAAVVEGGGVGAPDPLHVGGALGGEDVVDVAPGGDVEGRVAGVVGLAAPVHLPHPADHDLAGQGLDGLGPVLDQVVLQAEVDAQVERPVPRDQRNAPGLEVGALPGGGELLLPGVEVVVDGQAPAEVALPVFDGRHLGVGAAAGALHVGAEQRAGGPGRWAA